MEIMPSWPLVFAAIRDQACLRGATESSRGATRQFVRHMLSRVVSSSKSGREAGFEPGRHGPNRLDGVSSSVMQGHAYPETVGRLRSSEGHENQAG